MFTAKLNIRNRKIQLSKLSARYSNSLFATAASDFLSLCVRLCVCLWIATIQMDVTNIRWIFNKSRRKKIR